MRGSLITIDAEHGVFAYKEPDPYYGIADNHPRPYNYRLIYTKEYRPIDSWWIVDFEEQVSEEDYGIWYQKVMKTSSVRKVNSE